MMPSLVPMAKGSAVPIAPIGNLGVSPSTYGALACDTPIGMLSRHPIGSCRQIWKSLDFRLSQLSASHRQLSHSCSGCTTLICNCDSAADRYAHVDHNHRMFIRAIAGLQLEPLVIARFGATICADCIALAS